MASLPFRDINVHASASHYAFTSPSTPSAPTLVVDRPTGDLRLNDGALLGGKRVSSIAGILGMIKLRLDKYIIVITKAQPMGRLKGHMIYKVISTEFLPLRERPLHDLEEDNYLSLLKTFISLDLCIFPTPSILQTPSSANRRLITLLRSGREPTTVSSGISSSNLI